MFGKLIANRRMLIAAVVISILAIYFIPLGSHGLLEPDEGRYSEIPREMIESGNFITPMLNHVKYFEKPVLLYWMNAASFMTFGQNEFAARFATALCAVLGALTAGALGTFIFGGTAGLISGIVTALSLLYFAIGTINITDMPLGFFLTVGMSAFYAGHIGGNKKWYLLFYASMALGLLSKGLVAIVLPGGIIFWYIILTRKWKLFIEALYIPGIILFFVISVPWFYLVCRDNADFFHFFFIQEHFLRYATKMHHRYEPFWFFLPMIPAGIMPWTGFLLSLLSPKSVIRSPENRAERDANIYLLLWCFVILLFFSFSSSKLIPYIVPCMPPLAILIGADLSRMIKRESWHGGAIPCSFGIAVLFSAALIGYSVFGGLLPAKQLIPIALKVSAGLLLGPIAAFLLTTKGRHDYKTAAAAFCVSAFVFIWGLQGIYGIMGETRSMKNVSNVIIKERQPGDTIAAYGEVLQGIPFYTKQRVILVDHMGELEFGAKQKEGDGWFLTSADFKKSWDNGKKPIILVIEKERMNSLFPNGNPGEKRRVEVMDYAILFNREAK